MRHYRPLVVIPDDAPRPVDLPGCEPMLLSAYRRAAALLAGERHLFQIGNNAGHIYALPWIERVGGVVTVHDATMLHMTHWFATNEGAGTDSWRRFVQAADPQAARMLDHADGLALGSGAVGSDVSVLRPFLAHARAAVVHSALAASRVRAAMPAVPVTIIPHHADPADSPPRPPAGDDLQLLCIGFASRAKRIDLVLRAMRLLLDAGMRLNLTIAGEVRPEEVDVEALVAGLRLDDAVTFTGYLDEDMIDPLIARADLVLNLRDPTSGETSGTLSRAMALGRCAVVSDVGSYAELPDGAVVKMPPGRGDAETIAQHLWPYLEDRTLREGIGRQAKAWARANAVIDDVAEAYAQAIEQTYARTPAAPHPTGPALEFLPLQAMPDVTGVAGRIAPGSRALWWQERLLPLGHADGVLLTLGCDDEDAALACAAFAWTNVIDVAVQDEVATASTRCLLARLTPDGLASGHLDMLLQIVAEHDCPAVVIAFEDAFAPPAGLVRALERMDRVLAREATGPQAPLLASGPLWWSPPQWGGVFVKRGSWRG